MTKKREGRSCKKASLWVTDLVAAANLVLAFSYSFWTDFTRSAFSQTRYTDSVLASLEPRLFHSKLIFRRYIFVELIVLVHYRYLISGNFPSARFIPLFFPKKMGDTDKWESKL